MSKQRPILFSTPMVQAILLGRKTQTRRTRGLENVPDWINTFGYTAFTPPGHISGRGVYRGEGRAEKFFKCPYGQVGDILWVRESCTYIMRDHAHDLLEGQRNNIQWVYKASMHDDFMKYAKAYRHLVKYDAVMVWGVDTSNADEFVVINPSDDLFPVTFLNGFSE